MIRTQYMAIYYVISTQFMDIVHSSWLDSKFLIPLLTMHHISILLHHHCATTVIQHQLVFSPPPLQHGTTTAPPVHFITNTLLVHHQCTTSSVLRYTALHHTSSVHFDCTTALQHCITAGDYRTYILRSLL